MKNEAGFAGQTLSTEESPWPEDSMIELHCRKCKRTIEFDRAQYPDVPSWVARIEHDKCNICDDGDRSAEHWLTADGREPDPQTMPSIHDEAPCTDCGDTGITYQTERRCACQPPEGGSPANVVEAMARIKANCSLAESMGGTDQLTYALVSDLRLLLDLTAALRDHIINAYVEGAYQVHTHWRQDTDPDFGEAASDYAASVLL